MGLFFFLDQCSSARVKLKTKRARNSQGMEVVICVMPKKKQKKRCKHFSFHFHISLLSNFPPSLIFVKTISLKKQKSLAARVMFLSSLFAQTKKTLFFVVNFFCKLDLIFEIFSESRKEKIKQISVVQFVCRLSCTFIPLFKKSFSKWPAH